MQTRRDNPDSSIHDALDGRHSRRDVLQRTAALGITAPFLVHQSAAAQDAPEGGTLTVGSTQEPDSLNPYLSGLLVSWEVEELIFDNLTKVSDQNEFVPNLAAEVPSLENGGISADGLTYTYHLREDVTWHDGQPFTSADVRFTWETIMDPNVEVRSRSGFDRIERAEAPDDYTIVFQLNEPYAPFLETWSYLGILPQHLLQDQDVNTVDFNRAPVGTGPFMFKEWVTGSHIEVERNPDHFGGAAGLDRIIYKIVPSAEVLMAQIQSGEVDMAFRLSTQQAAQVQGQPDWTLNQTIAPAFFHFVLNNEFPLFSDIRVRQALSHGLDKEAITGSVLQGLVEPAWSPITPFSWAYSPDVPKYTFDPDKAAALLDEAGWQPGGDGIREKDGNRLTFSILNISGEQERLEVVQIAQQLWRAVGIDAVIEEVDAATFVDIAVTNKSHEAAYAFWSYGADPDPSYFYRSTAPYNYANYKSPEVDALLDEALVTVDQESRKELYVQIQDQIAADVPTILMFNRTYFDVAKVTLENFKPNPTTQSNMWNASQWRLAE